MTFFLLDLLACLSPVDGHLDLEIQMDTEFAPETTAVENARECVVPCI